MGGRTDFTHGHEREKIISIISNLQGGYFILTTTSLRWPFRARNMMELPDVAAETAEHPQWVSRWKLNFRRRTLLQTRPPAARATIRSENACCQSMQAT
jgi:hypothetical protein